MKLFGSKHGKYEGRHSSRRRKSRRSCKSVLPLCLILLLAVSLTIGGTLAFMQETTGPVTNTFKSGDITYTLNLEPNASNVEMPSKLTAQSGTSLSVTFTPDKAPTKTGYTFGGWYYDAACADENLHTAAPGTSITVEYGDTHDSNDAANKVEITLYAKWTPNTYEVAYNGNGATSGSMENSEHTYDVAKNLTANSYERTGYRFLGWSENQNATTATYTDEQSVTNLASENDAVVTLYAVWERMDFTVTFDTQAADVTADPASKTVTYQMTYGELPALTRTGYTFNGWALEKTGGTEITSTSTVGIAEDHTLYAQWTPYTYTVKYNNNVDPNNSSVTQPTGSTADSIHTYDVAKKLTENGFTRTGYTFIGWNTQPDGKGDSYANGESVTNLTSAQNGTVTLYAQWGVKSYVIRYHANGGNGTMADQVIEWDKLTKLRENTFTKDGDYSFAGWATSPDGDVAYLENQQVANLLESGTLDLYAVWLQNSYTVTFDYNIGYGTPPTKEVLYGEEYGVLPPYLTTETENLFQGWYTKPEGGERVYPDTIVDRKEDHTLWAHWDPSPANDVIKDLVVHSSADDDKDGVADDIHLEFRCSSSFEKFNIPLKNLVPGQKYALTYTASNNASFGDSYQGYKSSRYGSYVVAEPTENTGNINNALAQDIIATWNDRIEPDGNNDGSQAATNDAWLNGPWENRTITFTATASEMYWTWEFGLIEDGPLYDYNIYDISLEPVEPVIAFANKTVLKGNSSPAQIASQSNGTYSSTFTFDGDNGVEAVYYPITGLSAGMTYTITFDHEFSGPLIHDTKNNSNPSYEYGCGIMNAKPTNVGSKMTNIGTFASNTFVKKTVDGKVDSVTLTFKATADTAYWVWNMANCSDSTNTTTKVTVTGFSASNSGSSVTYYTATSKAGSAITLDLMPEEVNAIQFIWDGIDDTNMEIWYPVDEQYPVIGDSYELAFEPAEGYTMAEIITVAIDDVTYEVFTNGQTEDGAIAPVYDPETNVLSIPAELLTSETACVSVTASAVPVEIIITTEQPETTETETAETEAEEVAEETTITVALNLTNMTVQGDTTLQVGEDYSIVLVPDDGYQLPEIIRVEIDGTLYEVYTDGLEHRELPEGETELPPMPTFDPATGTLTIPAILLGETTQNVTITISAVEIVSTTETNVSEETVEETTETEASEVATEEETEEPTDETELATVSSGNAALPPDGKEEGDGNNADDGGDSVDPDGGEDGTNSDGADNTTETTESSSEEVAE